MKSADLSAVLNLLLDTIAIMLNKPNYLNNVSRNKNPLNSLAEDSTSY